MLLAQLRLVLGELGLRGDTSLLGLGLGERAGLCGLRLSLVDLGLVLRLDDRRMPSVLGLLTLGLLLGLGGHLGGLRLSDLRLALNRGVVRCRHRGCSRAHVVDPLDLEGIDDEPHPHISILEAESTSVASR